MKTLCLLFGLLPFGLAGQNYVVNGSFERLNSTRNALLPVPDEPCTYIKQPQTFSTFVEGWQTFYIMTPDLINWDSSAHCELFPKPRSGKRMLGLIMYHPYSDSKFGSDYHEMLQGSFAKPLTKGKTYRFSFWVYYKEALAIHHLRDVGQQTDPIVPLQCGNFGVYFSDAPANPKEDFRVSMRELGIDPHINREAIVEAKDEWVKITLYFKAEQAYKYFFFGNYFSDAITPTSEPAAQRETQDAINTGHSKGAYKRRIAYYCFDDFAVVEHQGELTPIEKALTAYNQYSFEEALLFDSGKSELKPNGVQELQKLALSLKNNATLKIEIAGHTDDVGAEAANQQLSDARAKAVYQALLNAGAAADQLYWKGYGEKMPLVPNDCDVNRQKNRRVTVSGK